SSPSAQEIPSRPPFRQTRMRLARARPQTLWGVLAPRRSATAASIRFERLPRGRESASRTGPPARPASLGRERIEPASRTILAYVISQQARLAPSVFYLTLI